MNGVAVSKRVGHYEVYQTNALVCIGVGVGFGSVVASKSFSSVSNASKAYKRLSTEQKARTFAKRNAVAFP